MRIKTLLRTAQAVCFDVDSTVIPEEGIDQLAAFQGAGAAVAEWTAKYVAIDIISTYTSSHFSMIVALHAGQWVGRCCFKMH